jgi:hypothetical protein
MRATAQTAVNQRQCFPQHNGSRTHCAGKRIGRYIDEEIGIDPSQHPFNGLSRGAGVA